MHGLKPDLLVVQEMVSNAGMTDFYNNVLNVVAPGVFTAVPFNDGPDTDNGVFYRSDKWLFISASYIATALRDIAEYVIQPRNSPEQLRIYSFHLKASSGSTNEQSRFAETTILRDYLNNLPVGANFILVGDFNIYTSSEPAWQKLIGNETNNNGRAVDPLNLTGNWSSNSAIAQHHTQSPRVRSFGGGSNGGMDDRFDIILTSTSMTDNILTSTYNAYGNDGNHFNDSINRLPNNAVPDSVANALHNASDHLPITARFIFPRGSVPIQLAYFSGSTNSTQDSIVLTWGTLTETINFGFEVQRRMNSSEEFETRSNSFIPGHGTTLNPQHYRFAEPSPAEGNVSYRLKQIDLDGAAHYTESIQITIVTDVAQASPAQFSLSQNYPNPFNPSTQIRFSSPTTTHAGIVVFDVLGREVISLFNTVAEAGKQYVVQFDGLVNGSALPSGVYFYRLTSGPRSELKRMILMK